MALVLIARRWHGVGENSACHWIDEGTHLMAESEEKQPQPRLADGGGGFGLMIALIVGVLFVMQQLRHAAALQGLRRVGTPQLRADRC